MESSSVFHAEEFFESSKAETTYIVLSLTGSETIAFKSETRSMKSETTSEKSETATAKSEPTSSQANPKCSQS
ncbi:hypothetical protein BN988_01742 [Oceanobacillus picturae]|uniref:Uncharacterized protein n=1 Tax=Oceanobacillus picturae TaxID=171693 RepID=W9AK07_9BACI|nr:hypothetical protein [Oceanobacillus picturae]CDO03237.1 hypothetical protein BN988_01742 [Oceanobacillus picturae]